jgi:tetrahydrodipicolinate N-succinyltransferase
MSDYTKQATDLLDGFVKRLERERDEARALVREFYLACVYLDKAIPVYGATNTERIRIAADEIIRLRAALEKQGALPKPEEIRTPAEAQW